MSGYMADGLCRYCKKPTRLRKNSKRIHLRWCNNSCESKYFQELRLTKINKMSPDDYVDMIMARPINDSNKELYEVIHEQSKIIMQLKEKIKKIEVICNTP